MSGEFDRSHEAEEPEDWEREALPEHDGPAEEFPAAPDDADWAEDDGGVGRWERQAEEVGDRRSEVGRTSRKNHGHSRRSMGQSVRWALLTCRWAIYFGRCDLRARQPPHRAIVTDITPCGVAMIFATLTQGAL